MTWPDGPRGRLVQQGRGRDLLTLAVPGDTVVAAARRTRVVVSAHRAVMSVDPGPTELVGAPAIGGLRRRLRETGDAAAAPGTLLFQLLDDIPGATIVSDFALRRWSVYADAAPDGRPHPARRMLGLCTGFTPGSSALNPDGSSTGLHHVSNDTLDVIGDDPFAWHHIAHTLDMSMRRARLIDVHGAEDSLHIDALFEDSSTRPEGGRAAVHQYRIHAVARQGVITELAATPGNLPYDECPLATGNVGRLLGTRLGELRSAVLGALRGTAGCTHLNDALRALDDVPRLAGLLAAHPANRRLTERRAPSMPEAPG